jgi:RecB family exonuclease
MIGQNLNPKIGALGLRPSQLDAVICEVGDLYQRFKRLTVEGFRSAEVALEVEPADGVTLRGVVDAVFDQPGGGARLVDWKTGALGDVEDQLAFYVLLWALERHDLPARIEAVSVGSGERFGEVPDRAAAEETAQRVADLVSSLRSAFDSGDDLERRGGPWCSFCPLLDGCAEGRAATA